MEEALTLIEQLIEEHKQILQRIQTAEQIANDAAAVFELDRAKDDFVPGRFSNQKQGLQNLKESLEILDQGLQKHFSREEGRLLKIFEQHRGGILASGLRMLLLEHQEFRDRIAESKKEVAELSSTAFSHEVLQGKAWGVRVYISHTRKLLQAHAQSEQKLFYGLRRELNRA